MGIFEVSIFHHVCVVFLLLWLLSSFNRCHPIAYFISVIYLYLVHERYVMRLRRKLRSEERRHSNQRRVLSDSETVRWLNRAVEKIWPVCMEQIVSQKILLPIIPWFLHKYKPGIVTAAAVQHLYMGRSPPMFTEMRVLRQSTGDDHLVLELGMNFRTADDMSAILAVKLRKELGFGMWAKLNLMGMHVEGKVLIGVKFLRQWPFLGRLRVCFVEPPYFQMTVKPIFTHGLDVTELPGIAGWLDKLLALAFEQTLVQPNMLAVDIEKFVSPQPESGVSVDEQEPVAYALVEVIEAANMKPSDLNGLADPYVKVQLGPCKFRTKIQRKTLDPKWHEEFKFPICTWESPNVLAIEVHDKDHFVDDTLGACSITIGDLRDGQRHDMWLPLRNIKMGRLHLAITVVEVNSKGPDQPCDSETLNDDNEINSFANETAQKSSLPSVLSEKSPTVADKYEPIDVEGQKETGIWVCHPGSEVSQIWEPRKGKSRFLDAQIRGESSGRIETFDSSSSDESEESNKRRPPNKVQRYLQKIGSIFSRNSRNVDTSSRIEEPVPSPHANLKEINAKEIGVKLIVEDSNLSVPSPLKVPKAEGTESSEGSGQETPSKRDVKDMAKSILKHAGNSARGVKHAFSRKWSKKSRGDLRSVVTERDIAVVSDSSDDEYLPSSVCTSIMEEIPVASKPISIRVSNSFKSEELNDQTTLSDPAMKVEDPINKVSLEGFQKTGDSFKSEELNDQTTLSDPAMKVEDPINKVSLEGFQKTGDDPSTSSEENDDVLVKESSNPKNSEENLEVEKKEDFLPVESQNLDSHSSQDQA